MPLLASGGFLIDTVTHERYHLFMAKMEIERGFPNVHEAITELQQQAVCHISETAKVKLEPPR